ncbi:MAG: hypothetical protein IPP51_15415 [Bacteroidetes bacterium]|nr:hypothetical protein [Bacteroidota bacterium]
MPSCNPVMTTCEGGLSLGIEKNVFQDTITFPFACTDWTILLYQYGRCSLVTTYGVGGNSNLVAHCVINNQDAVTNHSPVFINLLYTGQQQCYSFLTYDSDGDSLVYDLVPPRTGYFPADTLYYDAFHSHATPVYSSTPNTLNPFNRRIFVTCQYRMK